MRELNGELAKCKEFKDEDGQMDLLRVKMSVAKTIPLSVGVMRELREYLKFQVELQDTIIKTQEKDVVWNESQMIQYMNDYLPSLEKSGKIKILDPMLKIK
jgi:hypothetical protein